MHTSFQHIYLLFKIPLFGFCVAVSTEQVGSWHHPLFTAIEGGLLICYSDRTVTAHTVSVLMCNLAMDLASHFPCASVSLPSAVRPVSPIALHWWLVGQKTWDLIGLSSDCSESCSLKVWPPRGLLSAPLCGPMIKEHDEAGRCLLDGHVFARRLVHNLMTGRAKRLFNDGKTASARAQGCEVRL